MLNLDAIATKWRTDKVKNPLNQYSHDYMPIYEELLAGKSVKKVLEIGLGWAGLFHAQQVAGASVRMWAEAFPEADIYGADILPSALVNEGRIKSFLCDQSKEESVIALTRNFENMRFDLIVDDGSHVGHDQALTANILAPFLADDGVYVIEDVIGDGECIKALKFKHRIINVKHPIDGFDGYDILIVVTNEQSA